MAEEEYENLAQGHVQRAQSVVQSWSHNRRDVLPCPLRDR